ncbi:MAG TPA: AAA family ATPase [Dokdonella sp.]|uniref:AAA family ATPase n=1 Tax=Dokdonella sp. TaxID=2291710 RepID=UPI002C13D991|nr:AAA family ATPase [Dokdonella sp.]HUD41974.1 AAA family ATPase [Dokdonella sp.]
MAADWKRLDEQYASDVGTLTRLRGQGGEPSAARASTGQPLRLVDLSGLLAEPTPAPTFVIDDLIPDRELTMLGSHGGLGKTGVGLVLCAHVASGANTWAGFPVEDGAALFVSLEDRADVLRYRLRNIVEAYALDAEKIERRLTVLDGTAGDASLATEVSELGVRRLAFTATLEEVAEHAAGKRIVVIDNASDAFAGNENERRQVRAFCRELARIAREHDTAVVLLAHVDKHAARFGSQGNSYSGSTAWHNSVRARLALVATEGGVELVTEKLQHGKMADPVQLVWTDTGVLVPIDARVAQASVDATRNARVSTDAALVARAVQAAHTSGITVPTATTGPKTARHVLSTLPELPEHLQGKSGTDRFNRALIHALRQSLIVEQEYRDDHRHQKRRFVPPECAAVIPPIPPCAQPPQPDGAVIRGSSNPERTAAQLPRTAAATFETEEVDL